MRIAVFGLGYVGTVTAAGLASRGHDVWGVDVDPIKVQLVASGRSPVVEPGLEELVQQAVQQGRLRATTEAVQAIEGADVSLLCVGTPSTAQGGTDLTYLRRAIQDIRDAMDTVTPPATGFHSVVVRSTVPPGTGDDVVAPVFAPGTLPAGWEVGTAMCPEFLREGCGVDDFFNPPFVVLGSSERRVAESLVSMFRFLDRDVQHVGVRSAEALKYACNAFHATKVSFTNELSRIFRSQGIDSREVMSLFTQDRVLNISPAYLRPGFAYGGSCLPKDLRSLLHMARTEALDAPLLAGVERTNEIVVRDAVDRVIARGGQRVAVLRLTFKMDTDDLRESPYVDLTERLVGKGFDVRVYDPILNPDRIIGANLRYVEARLPHLRRLLTGTPEEALADADVVIVSTQDPTALAALRQSPAPSVIDLVGRLGTEIEDLPGYDGIGWVA
jgi:GDP-mannose 6-dehydrogenase